MYHAWHHRKHFAMPTQYSFFFDKANTTEKILLVGKWTEIIARPNKSLSKQMKEEFYFRFEPLTSPPFRPFRFSCSAFFCKVSPHLLIQRSKASSFKFYKNSSNNIWGFSIWNRQIYLVWWIFFSIITDRCKPSDRWRDPIQRNHLLYKKLHQSLCNCHMSTLKTR